MDRFLETISEILLQNRHRVILCSRNAKGLPNVVALFLYYWDADSWMFALFPQSETLKNIDQFPEVSLSVVDWVNLRGFQIKGLASRVQLPRDFRPRSKEAWNQVIAMGATQYVKVEPYELYDVIPKEGLNKPLWKKGPSWHRSTLPPLFSIPPHFSMQIGSVPLPKTLQASIEQIHRTNLTMKVPCFLGTVDEKGIPNVSPRFLLELNPDHWLYGDGFMNKTFLNITRPSPAAITLIDWNAQKGFQTKGWCETKFSGELIGKVKEHWERLGFRIKAIQAVLYHPEEIYEVELGLRRQVFEGHPQSKWLDVNLRENPR